MDTAAKAQVQLYEVMGANAQRFDLHAWPLFNVSHPNPVLVDLSVLDFFLLVCHDACRDRCHLCVGLAFSSRQDLVGIRLGKFFVCRVSAFLRFRASVFSLGSGGMVWLSMTRHTKRRYSEVAPHAVEPFK